MVKTLDILDKEIIELAATGREETFVSLPVVCEREGKLYLASFCWAAKSKQRNIPVPERVCYVPMLGASSVEIEEIPVIRTATVIHAGSPTFWAMKKITQDIDEVINDYCTSGSFPVHKYLYYLENMIPLYHADYRPIFAALNNPKWNIDLLKEAK